MDLKSVGLHLDKLKELTPDLSEFVIGEKTNRINYSVSSGDCYGLALMKSNRVAVQNVIISTNSTFNAHKHEEKEWAIFYKGTGIFFIGENEYEYNPGSFFYLTPGISHGIKISYEKTGIICITIPASDSYPNMKEANNYG